MVILAIFIPISSLYIIIRLLDSTKQIYVIAKYIRNNIEKEISNLLKMKLESDIYYSSRKIRMNETFLDINRYYDSEMKEMRKFKREDKALTETNFLYWERYTDQERPIGDYGIILIVIFLFSVLLLG